MAWDCKEFEAVEPSGTRTDSFHSSASSDSTAPLSPDHPLTHVSPTPTPTCVSFHYKTARIAVRAQPAMSPGLSASMTKMMALYRALGWHLEEIHVTWTQFGKKRGKIATLHKKLTKLHTLYGDGVRISSDAALENELLNCLRRRLEKCNCVERIPSGWIDRYFLIDKKAIPDVMPWRHHDSDIHDSLPDDNYNILDVRDLAEHIVDLCPVPPALLFATEQTKIWECPRYCPIFKDNEGDVLVQH
ncbi:hypothetical protein Tco_0089118 [Tanacetum coccineum]